MSTLILDNKALSLAAEGGAIVVRERGARAGTIPIATLERVVIHGQADLTADLLGRLGEARVAVLLLAKRNQRRRAILLGPGHNDVGIRIGQVARVSDPAHRRAWSARLVAAKLQRQHRHLRLARERRPDLSRPLLVGMRAIDRSLETIDTADVAMLLGLEGGAARAYFAALSRLFADSLGFTGRNRRPPRDPVNASLSLGYTLLHFEAVRAAHMAGLDPLLGFYHRPVHGRESLAADLIEPLRPAVDALIVDLFRQRKLRGEQFERRGDACLMGKTARSHFYPAWERFMAPYRRLLRRQCQRLARDFRAGGDREMRAFADEDWPDDE